MSCPKGLEILKILENKLYPDLGKMIVRYLNFIPPTPEELCLILLKSQNGEFSGFISRKEKPREYANRFDELIKFYGVIKSLKIEIIGTNTRFAWNDYNGFSWIQYLTVDTNDCDKLLKFD